MKKGKEQQGRRETRGQINDHSDTRDTNTDLRA